MDAIIERLRQCEIFAGIEDAVLALVASTARQRHYEPGEALFAAGEPRRCFFLLLEGQVEVTVESGDNAGFLLILGRRDGAGESGLLEDGVHTATGTAVSSLDVLELPIEEVRQKLSQDATAAMRVFAGVARLMVRRLQYATHRRHGWDQVYGPGTSRTEHDLLGEREVPQDARYGIQTLRAIENFPITGIRIAHFPHLIRALAMVKQAAARANRRLGLLPDDVADAIDQACKEIIRGHWHGHFLVDVVQGGAGTSTNMNANEVIANRALEVLGPRARRLRALPSQQPRQPLAVHERRLSHGRARRDELPAAGARRGAARAGVRPARQGAGVRRRPQDGAHAAAGRRPDDCSARSSRPTP